jgi:hypothetical protein
MNTNPSRRSFRRILKLGVGAAIDAGGLAVLLSDLLKTVVP